MGRPIYLATARADLAGILRYIAIESGSRTVANGFITKLERRCERLANLPGTLGTPRPELRADVRSVAEQGYVIFFRYVGKDIEIINILAGHRDIGVHFETFDQSQPH